MSKLSERVHPDVEAAPWVVEEIKELEAERDAVAAQIHDLRLALMVIRNASQAAAKFRDLQNTAHQALSIPDTSTQILARRDAAIWREAADVCDMEDGTCGMGTVLADKLRARADELGKDQ